MIVSLCDHPRLQPVMHPPPLEAALTAEQMLPAALRRGPRLSFRVGLGPYDPFSSPGLLPSGWMREHVRPALACAARSAEVCAGVILRVLGRATIAQEEWVSEGGAAKVGGFVTLTRQGAVLQFALAPLAGSDSNMAESRSVLSSSSSVPEGISIAASSSVSIAAASSSVWRS